MLEELKSIYSGKKIFLTGHTGFKGSWLLKVLDLLGAEVKGYSLKCEVDNSLYNLINGNLLCQSVIADIRDRDKLINEILSFEPDYIFHLAAQPLVRLSYQIPAETFNVNAIGTANLLDGARLLKKRCAIVLITTDKVYHNNEWVFPYRENDRLGGYDPYSASKACAELIIDSYKSCFFNPVDYQNHLKSLAVARAGNVIGGGDWSKDRLIPDIMKALVSNGNIIIRNPNSVRPWQHVLEPVIAYLLLGKKLNEDPKKYCSAFNFGPFSSDTLSVLEMVKLVVSTWGSGSIELAENKNALHEAGLLKLDITKAGAELKWYPKMNSQTAMFKTVQWYKSYVNAPNDISKFTEYQIVDYLNLLS